MTNKDKAKDYLNEPSKIYAFNQILNHEKDNRGLIILEAYFGLPEHIYDIHSGLVQFKEPQTHKGYYRCQIIPVAKQLQLLVKSSSLTLSTEILFKKVKPKKKEEEKKEGAAGGATEEEKKDPDNPEHVDYSRMINGIFNPTVKSNNGQR